MSVALVLIGVFFAGVLLNAFFAGYETGFVASNPIRIRYLAEKEDELTAKRLLYHLEHPDRMITVVLLGTNLALIMGTLAITRQIGPFWATIVATPIFLIFGEVVPKSMFRIHPTVLAVKLFPVIRFFDAVLAPVAYPVTWISQRVLALMDASPRNVFSLMTSPDDVRALVDESASQGAIEPEEQEMIHSIMDLQTRTAKEVMVPRIQIQAVPETATRSELVQMFTETGFTRIPIYRETMDDIIGVVSAFSVLTDRTREDEDIKRFVQPVLHVPDTMKLDDVLDLMRERKQRLAIVTDEYGGTDGFITVEDILEEIFGEIQDEHDREEIPIRKVGPNAYVVDAGMPLEDAADAIGAPIEDEEVDTVGGWLMHRLGRIPSQGEVIEFDRYQIMILEAGPNFVSRLRLEVLPESELEEHGEGEA